MPLRKWLPRRKWYSCCGRGACTEPRKVRRQAEVSAPRRQPTSRRTDTLASACARAPVRPCPQRLVRSLRRRPARPCGNSPLWSVRVCRRAHSGDGVSPAALAACRLRHARSRTDGRVIVDHELVLQKLDGQARLADATAPEHDLAHAARPVSAPCRESAAALCVCVCARPHASRAAHNGDVGGRHRACVLMQPGAVRRRRRPRAFAGADHHAARAASPQRRASSAASCVRATPSLSPPPERPEKKKEAHASRSAASFGGTTFF